MNNGYIEIVMPGHPYARQNGTVLMHRLVAEEKLGRFLKPEEVVHHIDFNKTNNDPDNLIVFKTNDDHSRFHKTGVLELTDDGTYISPELDAALNYRIKHNYEKYCKECGKLITNPFNKKFCSEECKNINATKSAHLQISKKELEKLIYQFTFTQIGKLYGVSDNAIRKRCKKFGLPYRKADINKLENNE